MNTKPLLEVQQLSRGYTRSCGLWKKQRVNALDNVSFTLYENQSLSIIGEAGSGKSTLARILSGAEKADSGQILLEQSPLNECDAGKRCRQIRTVFQDPQESLNPRRTIGQILEEPLRLNTSYGPKERRERVENTMKLVGLLVDHTEFYPHMLSAGQRQRVAIARALILNPRIIIADEPFAALDVSVRAQILNLLLSLQKALGLSYIFISNKLSVVRHVSDQVLVLDHGKIVESGSCEQVLQQPEQPITQRLLQNMVPSRK